MIFKKIKDNAKLMVSIYIISGLFAGVMIGSIIKYNDYAPSKIERHEIGYSYISPLIECFSNKSDSPKNNQLEGQIKEIISTRLKEKKILNVSVYFRDLANGPWIGINEGEKFTPASLLKVPIMITYYKLAETNPEILNKEILINESYQGDTIQNIIPQIRLENNKKYTIEKLINQMITQSDNHTANLLLENIPYGALNKTYDDLGLVLPTIAKPENYMSVKDYASFFRILYNASYLNKYYSEKALFTLDQSQYKNGLEAGVPLNIKVSHKFGERKNGKIDQLHDCGIIYKDNKDYLLCIMTRGDNFENLSETIKEISSLVYKNVN